MLPRDPRARLGGAVRPGHAGTAAAGRGGAQWGVAGVGLVHGAGAVALPPTPAGRRDGHQGCAAIVGAYTEAVSRGVPIVGLWHSGGARLAEGVASLHAVGTVFAAMTAASGRVPQISVVLGPAAGGAAYGPALTDIVILSGQGRSSSRARMWCGLSPARTSNGAPGRIQPHSRRPGVVHVVTDTDAEARDRGRQLAALLSDQGKIAEDAAERDLSGLLPDSARRAYDVHLLTGRLLDTPGVELHPRWAPNVVTILGRLAGRTVGVVASNPMRLGGCLDAASAEKAARFVRMCDAFGVPLVVLVDVPGTCPGSARNGTAWSAAARSCCTPSPRPRCPAYAYHPQGVRRRLHRHELPLAQARPASSPGPAPRWRSWARSPPSASCTAARWPRCRRKGSTRPRRGSPPSTRPPQAACSELST